MLIKHMLSIININVLQFAVNRYVSKPIALYMYSSHMASWDWIFIDIRCTDAENLEVKYNFLYNILPEWIPINTKTETVLISTISTHSIFIYAVLEYFKLCVNNTLVKLQFDIICQWFNFHYFLLILVSYVCNNYKTYNVSEYL